MNEVSSGLLSCGRRVDFSGKKFAGTDRRTRFCASFECEEEISVEISTSIHICRRNMGLFPPELSLKGKLKVFLRCRVVKLGKLTFVDLKHSVCVSMIFFPMNSKR